MFAQMLQLRNIFLVQFRPILLLYIRCPMFVKSWIGTIQPVVLPAKREKVFQWFTRSHMILCPRLLLPLPPPPHSLWPYWPIVLYQGLISAIVPLSGNLSSRTPTWLPQCFPDLCWYGVWSIISLTIFLTVFKVSTYPFPTQHSVPLLCFNIL